MRVRVLCSATLSARSPPLATHIKCVRRVSSARGLPKRIVCPVSRRFIPPVRLHAWRTCAALGVHDVDDPRAAVAASGRRSAAGARAVAARALGGRPGGRLPAPAARNEVPFVMGVGNAGSGKEARDVSAHRLQRRAAAGHSFEGIRVNSGARWPDRARQ